MSLRAGFVQHNPAYLLRQHNLEHVGEMLKDVDADLVVLPELFNSGYFFRSTEDVREASEPVPAGPTTAWLIEQAAQHEMTLVAGVAEEDGDVYYNSAVVVTPKGHAGTYRKTHLFYEENEHFSPGDSGLNVFELDSRRGETYRLGVMVCFDWYFPEASRTLALKGADIIAHPSNLVLPHCPRAMPVRAIENHVYTITANRYGTESNGREALTFIGNSLICNPQGEVLAQAGAEEDKVAIVEIDPRTARQRDLNAYNHTLQDRRPEHYA